jgi:hypothetical protein
MPTIRSTSFSAATSGSNWTPAAATDDAPEFECYCGLGPACPIFNQMTPRERTLCSQDKRRTGQQFWRNGLELRNRREGRKA